MNSPTISFIIPALNEEKLIRGTLDSIRTATAAANLDSEIILVDHGSSDNTVAIANDCGVVVFEHQGGTVGSLRNLGVQRASGKILVFIDADVSLTNAWSKYIDQTLEQYKHGAKLITGSQCAPPDDSNYFHKYWFGSFALETRGTHLGTGHLIVSKEGFNDIGGFDENLSTGEDYEFCERAQSKNYEIYNDVRLKVIHHDFPRDIASFIRREAWHGKGDVASFSHAVNSKVTIATSLFVTLHVALLVSLLCISVLGVAISLTSLVAILVGSSYLKNRHANLSTVVVNSYLFYFYYLGRSLAFKELLRSKK